MTKNEVDSQQQEEIIRRYDAWQCGDIPKDEYVNYLLMVLENYLKYCIMRKGFLHSRSAAGAEYEDFIQQGRLAILTYADSYNPYKSMPTTYFTPYINQFIKEIVDNTGLTQYYVGKIVELTKIARENGYTGLDDPNLSPDTLCMLSGDSLMTIMETKKLNSFSVSSLDAVGENFDYEMPMSMSPEEQFIEKEKRQYLQRQLNRLTPLERYLIIETEMSAKPRSFKSLVKELKTHEMEEHFSGEFKITQINEIFLKQKVNQALRHLRDLPSMHKYVTIKEDDYTYTLVEQATVEDIQRAIEENLVEL